MRHPSETSPPVSFHPGYAPYTSPHGNLQNFVGNRKVIRAVNVEDGNPAVEVEQSNYWKYNFLFVLLPFALMGLPVHVILPKESNGSEITIGAGWKQNLVCIYFRSVSTSIMTLLLLPLVGFLNYDFGSSAVSLLNGLIIKGQAGSAELQALLSVFAKLPSVLLVNYGWIYGHTLSPLITYFDSPVYAFKAKKGQGKSKDIDDGSFKAKVLQRSSEKQREEMLKVETRPEDRFYRKTLFEVYVINLSVHILKYFTSQHRREKEVWTSADTWELIVGYANTVKLLLILPVYMCVCGAIGCQVDALAGFVQSCINRGEQLKGLHVYLIKKAYKKIADVIVRANSVFRLYMALVVVVLVLSGPLKVTYAVSSVAFLDIGTTWVFSTLLPMMKGLLEPRGNETASAENGGDPSSSANMEMVPPEEVRYLIGVWAQAALFVYLLWLVLSSAIDTNDKARYLQVWVNDFATENYPKDNELKVRDHRDDGSSVDEDGGILISEAFVELRLLKSYMHSRMEVHAPLQRALLDILGIALLSKSLSHRLNGYHLSN